MKAKDLGISLSLGNRFFWKSTGNVRPVEPGAMLEVVFSLSNKVPPRDFSMTDGVVITGALVDFWPPAATTNLSMGVQTVGGITPQTTALDFNPDPQFHTTSATYKWFLDDDSLYGSFVDEVPLPNPIQIETGLLAAGATLRLSVINNV